MITNIPKHETIQTVTAAVASVIDDKRLVRRIVSALCDYLGGSSLYLPSLDRARQRAKAIELRMEGVSAAEIARRLEISRATVFKWIKEARQ